MLCKMFLERMKKQGATGRLALLRDSGFIAVFVFFLLLDTWLVVQAVASASPSRGIILFLTSGLLAWLLADFASGTVHFIADNFGSPDTPVLGRLLIAPFRQHHATPLDLLEHDFLERNANNAFIASPLLIWVPFVELHASWALFLACLSLQMAIWAALTNEIHAAAHASKVPTWVRMLQEYGVVLSPRHHQTHHLTHPPSGRIPHFHYCITSGICDRLAGALRWANGRRE
jgi:plasmanylethanolamine desaturase